MACPWHRIDKIIILYYTIITRNNIKNIAIHNSMTSLSHPLTDVWKLYGHLPSNPNWDIQSYILISEFSTVEQALQFIEIIPAECIQKSMLFLMKGTIPPIWEEPENKDGGYFSYKIVERHIADVWKQLCYSLVGCTITKQESIYQHINGMTISPKKKFSILKIWMNDASISNSDQFDCNIKNFPVHGCLFTPHKKK